MPRTNASARIEMSARFGTELNLDTTTSLVSTFGIHEELYRNLQQVLAKVIWLSNE